MSDDDIGERRDELAYGRNCGVTLESPSLMPVSKARDFWSTALGILQRHSGDSKCVKI